MNANNDDIINQVSPNKRIIEYISSLIQIKYQKERDAQKVDAQI